MFHKWSRETRKEGNGGGVTNLTCVINCSTLFNDRWEDPGQFGEVPSSIKDHPIHLHVFFFMWPIQESSRTFVRYWRIFGRPRDVTKGGGLRVTKHLCVSVCVLLAWRIQSEWRWIDFQSPHIYFWICTFLVVRLWGQVWLWVIQCGHSIGGLICELSFRNIHDIICTRGLRDALHFAIRIGSAGSAPRSYGIVRVRTLA